jgi:hypothetical protein
MALAVAEAATHTVGRLAAGGWRLAAGGWRLATGDWRRKPSGCLSHSEMHPEGFRYLPASVFVSGALVLW